MSQNSCCVPGCSVTIKDGIPLHRFPNPNVNAEKFNSWVSKIGGTVATMDNLDVYSNRRVCHKHFEEIHKYPSNRLCKLAVPVLYLPEQLHTESVTLPDLPSTSGYQRIPYEIPMREQLHTESVTLPDLASTSGYQRIPCEIPMRVQLFTKPGTMPALCSMSDIQKTSAEGQITGISLHCFSNPNVYAEKFNTWILKVGGEIAMMDKLEIFSNKCICHKHFEAIHMYSKK